MAAAVKIGTRGSQLALWQANWVRERIMEATPSIEAELVIIKTKGDKILDVPLAKVGGKGLFVKEIEEALLDGRIDMAIHSMKDMPAEIPPGLCIGAVPERETPYDALISAKGEKLADLPPGARVGTSSLRRSSQLLKARPDLSISPLRGNIDTRLGKVESGELDAIILAAAGLKRLGFEDRITEYLDANTLLPAVGQGALCIESRENDPAIDRIISSLDHNETHCAVAGERSFLHRLEGSCQVPVAAYAVMEGETFKMSGLVAELDGSKVIRESISGPGNESVRLGRELAERLLSSGAEEILENVKERADEIK